MPKKKKKHTHAGTKKERKKNVLLRENFNSRNTFMLSQEMGATERSRYKKSETVGEQKIQEFSLTAFKSQIFRDLESFTLVQK